MTGERGIRFPGSFLGRLSRAVIARREATQGNATFGECALRWVASLRAR